MSDALNNKTPQIVSLRIRMVQSRMTTEMLARKVGVSTRTLQNFYSTPENSQPLRFRIEKVLGIPIWSTHEQHQCRLGLEGVLGFDPCLAKFRRLQLTAKFLRVSGWTKATTKQQLISLLGEHLLQRKPVCAGRRAVRRVK